MFAYSHSRAKFEIGRLTGQRIEIIYQILYSAITGLLFSDDGVDSRWYSEENRQKITQGEFLSYSELRNIYVKLFLSSKSSDF